MIDWAGGAGASLIPSGGESSVVGGVRHPPTGVVDQPRSPPARQGAGDRPHLARGPRRGWCVRSGAGEQLRPHRLALQHFPQSFDSPRWAGGLLRAQRDFATLDTHIDDYVKTWLWSRRPAAGSRRLPGSGAGTSPDRMFVGSEGILGVITEAWMRLQPPALRRRRRRAVQGFFTAARALPC